MRERLIELFEEMDKNPEITCPKPDDVEACKNCRYAIGLLCDIVARKVDYLLANGVIVPPCKVGDTVWFVVELDDEIIIEEWTADYMCYGVDGWLIGNDNGEYIRVEDNMYHSRKEAERALKECELGC